MNADRLLALYERVADAPDAITRLRRFVLDLAMRGRLVEQDATDEPASELLKRIAADRKERAISARDRRAGDPKPLCDQEASFTLPPNWIWVAFGDVMISRDGERVPVSKAEREQREKVYDYYGASGIIDKIDGYLFDKPLLLIGEDGANLVNRSTPIAFIARGKYWVNNHAHVLDGLNEQFLRFVELFINATDLTPYVTGTAQPKMNQAKMNSIPVVLPPLAEQHRIVAKVDELMALCDRLTAASLARLSTPDTDAETFRTHARFTLDTLPALTTRPDQIKALRQTILNLAVRGKLVEQEAGDEPTEEILCFFRRTKEQLLRSKKLKRSKPISNPISRREDYVLPQSWSWASCDELFFVTKLAGFEYTKYFDLKDQGDVPVIRAQNVRPWSVEERNLKFLPENVSLELERSAIIKPTILITFIGAGIGDVALFEPERRWHLAPNVAKAELLEGCEDNLDLRYVVLFFNSPVGQTEIFKHVKAAAQPSLSMGTIRDIDVIVPPLAEQHRIVAKVDALMALCDQLEKNLAAADTDRHSLLESLLHEALAPTTAALEAA